MTLTTRLAIAMVLLVAVAVSAVGWLSYRNLEQVLLPRILDRIETHSRLVAPDLQSYVAGARGDIASFRSLAALHGLMRAHLAGGIDPHRRRFRKRHGGSGCAARLAADLDAKPPMRSFASSASQTADAKSSSRTASVPSGAVRLAPDAELQRMGDRAYFTDTIKLPRQRDYTSRRSI